MSGLLKSHKTILVVLAVLTTFALTASSGFGWGTGDQGSNEEKAGEHADKEKGKEAGKDESKSQGKDDEGKDEGDKDDEGKGEKDHGEKGKDHGEKGKGDHGGKPKPGPGPGPVGPGGPGAPVGPVTVNNQVTNNITQTQTQTQSQAPSVEGQVKGETESVKGEEAQGGGGGREVAQVDTGEESVETAQAQGGQPAELASTGVNTGALALVGALCVAASLLLFRRRRSA
jgi:LPXTG-motif cell wall-anchored protein